VRVALGAGRRARLARRAASAIPDAADHALAYAGSPTYCSLEQAKRAVVMRRLPPTRKGDLDRCSVHAACHGRWGDNSNGGYCGITEMTGALQLAALKSNGW